ncbi:MAG: iron-containing alcohol dehydrogenase [Planctomycetaceae bacterium]|nr:iron-containing alcohol dehydrogenase [Planctomycetaceae bacterium]
MAPVTESAPTAAGIDYDPRTRVIYGAGCLSQVAEQATRLGGRRILLVTDPGLRAAGHEARVLDLLQAAGQTVHVYDEVQPNPTTDDVARSTAFARQHEIDLIIGLGGGSSMDCAKGTNFLLTNGGQMQDYRGIGKATRPMLPLIAIPTTAGTGSEAQSFAVIADAQTHLKMACGDKKAAARIAILDPELTTTMPTFVTAVTGIDAISHAVESYVSKPSNVVSKMFARQAWNLLNPAFERVLADANHLASRGDMLLGAHLAGASIENSMLGATHALANPLTAHFDLTHGVAIGLMLPHVIKYNARAVGSSYVQFVTDAGIGFKDTDDAALQLAKRIVSLVRLAKLPVSLKEAGVDAELLPQLAAEAAEQWTGRFNPRTVNAADLLEIYQCALNFDGESF